MDWYYAQDGRQLGPVPETELTQLARDGVVTPETLVWHSGMAEWQAYRSAVPTAGATAGPAPGAAAGAIPGPWPGAGHPDASTEPHRYCSSCGNSFATSDLAFFGESAVCAGCKPAYVQRLRQGMTSTTPRVFHYGGFWIRFVAIIIDSMILGCAHFALAFSMGLSTVFTPRSGVNAGVLGLSQLLSIGLSLAYNVFFWTQYGATPGKMVLHLKVVTPDGGPISIGQAVGRHFAQWLSALILFIGYMMAGWDDQKRALHDRIAGTRVIRTE